MVQVSLLRNTTLYPFSSGKNLLIRLIKGIFRKHHKVFKSANFSFNIFHLQSLQQVVFQTIRWRQLRVDCTWRDGKGTLRSPPDTKLSGVGPGDAVHLRHVWGAGQEAQWRSERESWADFQENWHQRGRRSHRKWVHQRLFRWQGEKTRYKAFSSRNWSSGNLSSGNDGAAQFSVCFNNGRQLILFPNLNIWRQIGQWMWFCSQIWIYDCFLKIWIYDCVDRC